MRFGNLVFYIGVSFLHVHKHEGIKTKRKLPNRITVIVVLYLLISSFTRISLKNNPVSENNGPPLFGYSDYLIGTPSDYITTCTKTRVRTRLRIVARVDAALQALF